MQSMPGLVVRLTAPYTHAHVVQLALAQLRLISNAQIQAFQACQDNDDVKYIILHLIVRRYNFNDTTLLLFDKRDRKRYLFDPIGIAGG